MPTHAEQRTVPYTPQQMFDLVADVEKYHEFLPWCVSCRITKRQTDALFYADLVIGYKMFREKFESKVVLDRPDGIRVEYLSGPLKHLSNRWLFLDDGKGGCLIDFYVDFEFHNPLFKSLVNLFFNEVVKRMVHAFEERARALYAADDRVGVTGASRSPS